VIDVLIVGLAAWRVASLIVHEDGPLEIFDRLRRRAGVYAEGPLSQIATMLTCVWCVSIWTALALWALHGVVPVATAIMAASAVAVAVETYVRK